MAAIATCVICRRIYSTNWACQYGRLIIWHYENSFPKFRNNLATHYDLLLWVSKTDRRYYRTIREPYRSVERLRYPVNKDGEAWVPHPEGRRAGDVWKYPTLAGKAFASETG